MEAYRVVRSRCPKHPGPVFWRVSRSLCRLHLWIGTAAIAYILFVSLSGGIVLFEQELYRFLSPDPALASSDRQRLSVNELMQAASLKYPSDRVVGVWDRKVSAGLIAELWLEGGGELRRRLFDPYSGADLGNAQPFGLRVLAFLRDAHTNLLAGRRGRTVNGIGSLAMVLLSLSGASMWLMGLTRPRPDLDRPAAALTPRALRLHRRAGVWMICFAAVWGGTGACFAFPSFVHKIVASEAAFDALYAIHSGAAGGWLTKVIWAASSLLTVLLALTGATAWRRRLLRPALTQ